MADTKISALTAASAVAGANEFAINEAGTSKKVTGTQIQTFIQTGLTMTGAINMGSQNLVGALNLGVAASSTLTIASDAITMSQSFHLLETEGAAATDNVDTISSGAAGARFYIFKSVSSARDPTIVDGTSFNTVGNFTFTTNNDTIMFFGNGTTSIIELARSDIS